jgi:hypothetical protein
MTTGDPGSLVIGVPIFIGALIAIAVMKLTRVRGDVPLRKSQKAIAFVLVFGVLFGLVLIAVFVRVGGKPIGVYTTESPMSDSTRFWLSIVGTVVFFAIAYYIQTKRKERVGVRVENPDRVPEAPRRVPPRRSLLSAVAITALPLLVLTLVLIVGGIRDGLDYSFLLDRTWWLLVVPIWIVIAFGFYYDGRKRSERASRQSEIPGGSLKKVAPEPPLSDRSLDESASIPQLRLRSEEPYRRNT